MRSLARDIAVTAALLSLLSPLDRAQALVAERPVKPSARRGVPAFKGKADWQALDPRISPNRGWRWQEVSPAWSSAQKAGRPVFPVFPAEGLLPVPDRAAITVPATAEASALALLQYRGAGVERAVATDDLNEISGSLNATFGERKAGSGDAFAGPSGSKGGGIRKKSGAKSKTGRGASSAGRGSSQDNPPGGFGPARGLEPGDPFPGLLVVRLRESALKGSGTLSERIEETIGYKRDEGLAPIRRGNGTVIVYLTVPEGREQEVAAALVRDYPRIVLSAQREIMSERMGTGALNPNLVPALAGTDYPTDRPLPSHLAGKQILVIGDRRIIVDGTAKLSNPIAGIDYPTDTPVPDWAGGKVIVFKDHHRLAINVQRAQAGVDYPTDGPPGLGRNFLDWVFSADRRIPLNNIHGLEKAMAGIDYPTDGPSHLDRDFYVAVAISDAGRVRTRIPTIKAPVPQTSGRPWSQAQIEVFVRDHGQAISEVPGVREVKVEGIGLPSVGGPSLAFLIIVVDAAKAIADVKKAIEARVPDIAGLYGVMGAPNQVQYLQSEPRDPPPLHPTVNSVTTDKIVNMKVVDGNHVRISVGYGAGTSALGGAIGVEIDGRRFAVTTRRGQDTVAKLLKLKGLIEAGGFNVAETPHQGIDTIELAWVIVYKGARRYLITSRGISPQLSDKIRQRLREDPRVVIVSDDGPGMVVDAVEEALAPYRRFVYITAAADVGGASAALPSGLESEELPGSDP